jgi:putative transposase
MKEHKVVAFQRPDGVEDPLTELLRRGADDLIARAVETEFAVFMTQFTGVQDGDGRLAVVRNGYQPGREILTGIGPVSVRIPKVRSRTEAPAVFHSGLVPPYVRRARSLDAALPWLYLHGVSTGDMSEALSVLVGPEAANLSAPVVSRLKAKWAKEYETCPTGNLVRQIVLHVLIRPMLCCLIVTSHGQTRNFVSICI